MVFTSMALLSTVFVVLSMSRSLLASKTAQQASSVVSESLSTSYRNKESFRTNSISQSVPPLVSVAPLFKADEPCHSFQERSVVTIDEELMFWWDGQPKLCSLIKRLKGVARMQDSGDPLLINIVVNCTDLKVNNGLGTGNWLAGFFMARLAASFSFVHLRFRCSAGDYRTEILPYLQGCYEPDTNHWPANNATEELICKFDMKTAPIHYAAKEIREVIRHLVFSATGFQRPPLSVPVNTTMFGEVVFDEVAIHFRCGDVLNLTNPRGDYGFTRYPEFKKRISTQAKSIGVVTQSFDPSRNRERDQKYTHDCRKIVGVLVDKLRADFPSSTISIRNGPSETITLAYARLAVAEQTIIGLSSFGAFPILANYGTSYFEEGRLLVNKWLNFVPEMMDGMVAMKSSEFLRNRHVMKKGINFTMHWLAG